MLLFQLFSTFFILFVLNRVVSRYKDARIPKSEIIVWCVFWLLAAVAIWWPRGTDILANKLGISRGVELVVAVSLAIIFFLLFKLFSHIYQLQQQITQLVRKLSLKESQSANSQDKTYE